MSTVRTSCPSTSDRGPRSTLSHRVVPRLV